jgi:hypothetical protein
MRNKDWLADGDRRELAAERIQLAPSAKLFLNANKRVRTPSATRDSSPPGRL